MCVLCVEDHSAQARNMKERHVQRMVAMSYGAEYMG